MKFKAVVTMATLMISVAGVCGNAYADGEMTASSASIVDGSILKVHACGKQGGRDMPLQLTVSNVPAGAQYLAIIGDDPDAVRPAGKVWVHWNVFNIAAASEFAVEAGGAIAGDQGRTSGNAKTYEGMCPPDGTHTYRFAVFAYKGKVDVGGFFGPSAMTIEEFESKVGERLLGKAVIQGKF